MKRNKRKLKLSNFFNKRNHKNRKKRSGKKRRIFASAIFAGNLLFGNLKTNDLKTQNYSNATPLTQEKVISNKEFNNLDGSGNAGKTVRTGNNTILLSQQEQTKTTEALKSALEIRSGELGKNSNSGGTSKSRCL